MIRIGVCDDNPSFLSQTKFMIDHWDDRPQDVVTELFEDGDSLLAVHSKRPFDIVLLDIVMPLLNGMEVAKEIREFDNNVKIIFLTSSVEFAIDSYSVKATNYLLKPVNPAALFSCLGEVIAELQTSSKSLSIKGTDAFHRVSLFEIEYIESQNKSIVFYTIRNKKITSKDPLYSYENMLFVNNDFFRCHRSYIVNMHHIERYTPSEIVMRSGTRIPISRSHQKAFEEAYFRAVFQRAGEC